MSAPEIQSARELGLMHGFPPESDQQVTHANQLLAPYNRWSFQNILKLNRTADVWRGNGPVSTLIEATRDLSSVTYQNRLGQQFTFDDMVERSYTDGIIVLHRGEIIYERYLNGMQPHTLHAWASCSKSMTGTLAAMLIHEGLIDPDLPVTAYLPELAGSGFADATVRQVMDMTTHVGFPANDPDPVSESVQYAVAMGWKARPDSYDGPVSGYDFLKTMTKTGEHGVRFEYLTPNSDVLAWIMMRILNQPLSQIMSKRIWSKLGAERDAFWVVNSATTETAGSGLVTTLRDMARFGQMMLQRGYFNGQQIVPAAAIEDIERGADKEAFARSLAASPANQGYSYHLQWWNTHNEFGAYQGLGYGGQMLYIAPAVQLVVAKFSSFPTPTDAGQEFYAAMAALPALSKSLSQG